MNTARPYEGGEVPIASHARSDAQVRRRRCLPWGLGEQRLAGKREREGTSLSCRRRWRERVSRDKNTRRFPLQHSPPRPHRLEHTPVTVTPPSSSRHSAVVAKGRAPLAPPDCGCGCSSRRHSVSVPGPGRTIVFPIPNSGGSGGERKTATTSSHTVRTPALKPSNR
jgi:hypothetical protein